MGKTLFDRTSLAALRRAQTLASLVFLAAPLVGCATEVEVEPDSEAVGTVEQRSSICIGYQQGSGGANTDTYVSPAFADQNFGALTTFTVNNENVALIRFDLGPLPSNFIITSAELHLYVTDSLSPLPISVRRVLAPWDEGTVTYLGLDQQLAPEISGTLMPVSGVKWQSVNITSLVQSWVSGAASNYGLSLDQRHIPQATKASNFFSSESTYGQAYFPALTLCYQVPSP